MSRMCKAYFKAFFSTRQVPMEIWHCLLRFWLPVTNCPASPNRGHNLQCFWNLNIWQRFCWEFFFITSIWRIERLKVIESYWKFTASMLYLNNRVGTALVAIEVVILTSQQFWKRRIGINALYGPLAKRLRSLSRALKPKRPEYEENHSKWEVHPTRHIIQTSLIPTTTCSGRLHIAC